MQSITGAFGPDPKKILTALDILPSGRTRTETRVSLMTKYLTAANCQARHLHTFRFCAGSSFLAPARLKAGLFYRSNLIVYQRTEFLIKTGGTSPDAMGFSAGGGPY